LPSEGKRLAFTIQKLLSIWVQSAAPDFALLHLETAAKPLKLLERGLADFSKCALKSLDNQADFDSAIPRFESWRPSQRLSI
jgi:hypothetical protein